MKKSDVLEQIRKIGLVPVLRAESESQALALAGAIADGGVTCMEVTMTVPGALKVMARLAKERPEILLGAGTVLDAETAKECVGEGATFIVSPAFDEKTVSYCRAHEIAVLPGALTPTEVIRAWDAGADVVKIFPASAMGGAKYLKSLKAPLPNIEMIPTGGVSLATAHEFLDAGAYALGVGADLVDTKAIRGGHPETVTAHARKYMEIVKGFQAGCLI
ncbi:bifunctional 4-hydroxy-2-oxoglutarate aldolase/2-dehydro-3-deoxy-phosphogluconate aldolase [Granulicella sp. 5B5]|uniref:bifunctional 4-hydroxy-2-oxoglutarate aldolase/2-dehydro-3-deoxy-phosphogluconate aldolase n=1 Tax=Granulicella sp. 5B5 TaxID=1617967 RepID=UPI0015F497CF|nr:bifunctional 4-hydroxy-2-oxoglutarate aldolase/2-dehydro-3-deoxy-phosphogluconate aldolase [Granulicella sp. 5B5]QMV17881.1 bifunctional 4-hydroxy-2-oxoglutarate aldolase/2-dehydro-3-deoxy-phosphogluconate aldolase [Granulicella sp. 5B5]